MDTSPCPWVLVDPEGAQDRTRLLQAALDSGSRYIALKNTRQFVVSDTLVVNGSDSPRNVEVVYGLVLTYLLQLFTAIG